MTKRQKTPRSMKEAAATGRQLGMGGRIETARVQPRTMAGRIEAERAALKRKRILREGAERYKEAMKSLAKR